MGIEPTSHALQAIEYAGFPCPRSPSRPGQTPANTKIFTCATFGWLWFYSRLAPCALSRTNPLCLPPANRGLHSTRKCAGTASARAATPHLNLRPARPGIRLDSLRAAVAFLGCSVHYSRFPRSAERFIRCRIRDQMRRELLDDRRFFSRRLVLQKGDEVGA